MERGGITPTWITFQLCIFNLYLFSYFLTIPFILFRLECVFFSLFPPSLVNQSHPSFHSSIFPITPTFKTLHPTSEDFFSRESKMEASGDIYIYIHVGTYVDVELMH